MEEGTSLASPPSGEKSHALWWTLGVIGVLALAVILFFVFQGGSDANTTTPLAQDFLGADTLPADDALLGEDVLSESDDVVLGDLI